eukprot:1490434-Rhodomonas_salina.1
MGGKLRTDKRVWEGELGTDIRVWGQLFSASYDLCVGVWDVTPGLPPYLPTPCPVLTCGNPLLASRVIRPVRY